MGWNSGWSNTTPRWPAKPPPYSAKGTLLNEKTLRTLEFDHILERLAGHAGFTVGRELALALRPSPDHGEVRYLQRLTAEALAILRDRPAFSVGGAHDVRAMVGQAALGGVLEPLNLLDIASTLDAAREVRRALTRDVQAPLLAAVAERIEPLPSLSAEIRRAIDPRGDVTDAASVGLGAIRRELRLTHDRLVERMQEIMRSAVSRGVAQEPLVTLREGRYVIPIKAEQRSQFPGVVHDISQSGATIFVEPLSVVDAGNRWREMQIEEQREIERVLRGLSADVGSEEAAILDSIAALGEIDLVLAKARYGIAIAAPLPLPGEDPAWLALEGEYRLIDARHPLLKGDVVPISLAVGVAEARVLLITGPNTGGKTVALKTAGLLACMAQAGLPVPAEAGSRLPVYREIFVDIGDEQSIEQSLSTFSGHVSNIIAILRDADVASLVLLDELAAGTDPAEGAPLARAVLEALLERGSSVLATTHHGELKAFAHETTGVMNASVEFDPRTLAPTYRVVVGLPGGSNAFAIARRLGMPEEIVRRAEDAVAPEQAQLTSLLTQAQVERDQLSGERQAEQIARREAEEIRAVLAERLRGIEEERESVLGTARAEIEEDVREARLALRRAGREIERAERAALLAAAPRLDEASDVAERIERRRRARHRRRDTEESTPADRIIAGDRVWLTGLDQPGEALGSPDERGELEVMLGSLHTRVRREQVRRIARGGGAVVVDVSLPPPPTSAAAEIEVRGQTLDEAMPQVETFLDQAFRAGITRVRIIHGKGTGTLRCAVRDRLATHPLVRSYETAERTEGGEGVTVAYMGG